MKRFGLLVLVLGLAAGGPGCAKKEEPKPQPGGISITAPGVNMKVGPDGNVQILAPGVDLKAGQGGANVNAPGVNVNVPAPNP